MSELIFFHPNTNLKRNRLKVAIKPDGLEWSYGLNTANFPTYGGEVVQILSAYFDDITVTGMVRTVAEVEEIYSYFIDYMQIATQGKSLSTKSDQYDTRPIIMSYPHRGWNFQIQPKALPGFEIGRDIVAPTWQLVAAIQEPDTEFVASFLDLQANSDRALELFGKAVLTNFPDPTNNPFSDPLARAAAKTKKSDLANDFNGLLSSYLDGTFDELSANYSKPTFLSRNQGDQRNTGPAQVKAKVKANARG